MVERSLSMREVRGSIPRCSNFLLDFFPLRRPPRWEVCCWSRGLLAHSDVRATGNGADRAIAARGREARVYIHRSPPRASRSRQMSVRARVLRAVPALPRTRLALFPGGDRGYSSPVPRPSPRVRRPLRRASEETLLRLATDVRREAGVVTGPTFRAALTSTANILTAPHPSAGARTLFARNPKPNPPASLRETHELIPRSNFPTHRRCPFTDHRGESRRLSSNSTRYVSHPRRPASTVVRSTAFGAPRRSVRLETTAGLARCIRPPAPGSGMSVYRFAGA